MTRPPADAGPTRTRGGGKSRRPSAARGEGADTPEAIREAVARVAKARPRAAGQKDAAASAGEARPAAAAEKLNPEKLADAVRRAEALLFASAEPVDAAMLAAALPPGVEPGDVLVRLKEDYRGRGVQLVELAGKWRFQTAPDLAFLFEETRQEPRQLSRAAMETLAIIAYCQPVTRAEIEHVRGVQVSRGAIDTLMEVGWVRMRGRRRTPGRPVTFGTTPAFLVHFGLDSLDSLPGREEMARSGLLSAAVPDGFAALLPRDRGEEDPLDDADGAPVFAADFLDGAADDEGQA